MKLSDDKKNLFHFISAIGKIHSIWSDVTVNLFENPIQNIESKYYGIFQLYFYENLFGVGENNEIIAHKNLNLNKIYTLLNELLFLDQNENDPILRIL